MVTYTCETCGMAFPKKRLYTGHTCSPGAVLEPTPEPVSGPVPVPRVIRYIDLFCGLGAFHYAFNSLQTSDTRYECVLACDIDTNVRKIYEANYGIRPEGDIHTIDIGAMPDFDILCGGFPCQPFSIAGKKAGFDDPTKGNLFYAILKIVDVKDPPTIILENVKNLVTIHEGETFRVIRTELENRGYTVSHQVIDSKFYGSPQSRQRIFIVASRTHRYEFPPAPSDTVVPVSTILNPEETRCLNYTDKYLLEPCNDVWHKNHCKMLFKLVHKTSMKGGRQGERVYSVDTCGPTICASSGGPGAKTGLYYVGGKVRRLNVGETLKMFGFAADYQWSSVVRDEDMLFYLGNCIVVNVVQALLPGLLARVQDDLADEPRT